MRYKSFDKRDRPGGLANWLGLMTLAILAVTSQTAPAQNTTSQDELAELYGPGESGPVRVQPTTLNPEDVDIGLTLPDLEFADINGNISRLSDLLQGKHALIVAVRDTACPVSSRYAPRLGELERELLEHQVGFLFLNPGPHDNLARIRREIESNHLKGPYVHDKSGEIARAFNVVTTTEVFLLSSTRELLYRGAIDDQYGIGYARAAPLHHYLRDAVESLLVGELPGIAATTAPGCFVDLSPRAVATTGLTYYKDIAAIVQNNCQHCHRPGESGPFPLMSYEDVAHRRETIRFVLQNRVMPPWFAAPGTGPWKNDRRLTDTDRETLLAWINDGAPAGDLQDAPAQRQWPARWRIGKPDIVFEVPEPINIPAQGTMPYQFAVIRTDFEDTRWVRGLELRSNTPELVHHILVFRVPRDFDMDQRFEVLSGGYFAVLAPGTGPLLYPDTMAKRLPRNYDLLFQIHYQPNGTPGLDQPRLGLKFAEQPPLYEIRSSAATSRAFVIPPGATSHKVVARSKLREDARLISFAPHMHVRGKAFQYELQHADGNRETVLRVPRYDFNWQLVYELETPLSASASSEIIATGWFDNSRENPLNPDPDAVVRFGLQAYDEMMIGYYDWYRP